MQLLPWRGNASLVPVDKDHSDLDPIQSQHNFCVKLSFDQNLVNMPAVVISPWPTHWITKLENREKLQVCATL